MSRGLKGGYTRIANYLLDELINQDFSKRELKILLYVLRNGYGFNKDQSKTIYKPQRIYTTTGLDPSAVRKILSDLCERNILELDRKSKTIKFNRHIETWNRVKTTRFQNHKNGSKQPTKQVKTTRLKGQNDPLLSTGLKTSLKTYINKESKTDGFKPISFFANQFLEQVKNESF